MSCNRKSRTYFIAIAALVCCAATLVNADMLVTVGGDAFTGKVSKTATGYVVQTSSGDVTVAAVNVKRVLYDHGEVPTEVADPKPKVADVRSRETLIKQGAIAFNTGHMTDARDCFADALSADAASATAGRGLGFAYIRLGNPAKAEKPLEIAAGKADKLDRSLTLAISASLVATHNPMRAIKYISAYLDAHPMPTDETMLNALGSAIYQIPKGAMHGALFSDATMLYAKLNSQLEDTQPGKKRWGIAWFNADEVAQKLADHQTANDTANTANSKLQEINRQLASIKEELADITPTNEKRVARKNKLQKTFDDLQMQQTKAAEDAQTAATALVSAPGPTFPSNIVINPGDLQLDANAPAIAGTTNIAVEPSTSARDNTFADAPEKPAATVISADPPPLTDNGHESAPTVPEHFTRFGVAFAISPNLIVAPSAVVANAVDIHIETADGTNVPATIVRTNQGLGLALLKVDSTQLSCLALSPLMSTDVLTAWGYPKVDLFSGVPQPMACSAPSPRAEAWSVKFHDSPRLPGGPILQNGLIVGIEMASHDTDPADVPAITLKTLRKFLDDDAKPGAATTDAKNAVVQITAEQ